MAVLVWDKVGERDYEFGLDRGVLYLPDGTGIPWNGLTSVVEKFDKSVNSVYFDGMKINDLVTLGDYSATMKAFTYPDEFDEIEGLGKIREGAFLADQVPKVFSLSYRTKIANDITPDEGYKIHILYNVTAIPSDKSYATMSDSPSLVEFEWSITAVPEETLSGFRPTAHIIIDTTRIDPWTLAVIEGSLYGTESDPASLLSMDDLVELLLHPFSIEITDNGDGTWTVLDRTESRITYLDPPDNTTIQIVDINAVYLNPETYNASDTL